MSLKAKLWSCDVLDAGWRFFHGGGYGGGLLVKGYLGGRILLD